MAMRPAEPADAPAIRALHIAAFASPAEADLVERIEADGDKVASLVADREGELAGHALLSRMRATGDGRSYRAVGLGPVAVLTGHRGAGIGAALIEGALGIAGALGEELAFVLGEPDYYRRFGFTAEAAAPFASPYAGPYFMALALRPGIVPPAKGEAAYAPAFAALQ